MKIKTDGYSILIFILFFIFGVVFTLQIKTTLAVKKTSLTVEQKIKEYTDEIERYSKRQKKMEKKISEQEDILNQNINDTSSSKNNEIKEWYAGELKVAKLKAGLTDVKGSGISIVIQDAPKEKADEELNNSLIHDSDIYRIVNELIISGAQAIEINGERIVGVSEILCAGPTVRINNLRYPSPYTIKAIGNSNDMYNHMINSYIIRELKMWNIYVDIYKEEEINISKFKYSIEDSIKYLEMRR